MDPRNPENNDSGEISEASNRPEVKRLASRTVSRSVATLSTEQLARKRIVDREAQRSIRQRTKERIERAENRIRELTEGQYGHLEEIEQRNAILEREVVELRHKLAMIDSGVTSPNGGNSTAYGPWYGQPSGSMYSSILANPVSPVPECSLSAFDNIYGQVHPVLNSPFETGPQSHPPLKERGQMVSIPSHTSCIKPFPTMSHARPMMDTPALNLQNSPGWNTPLRFLAPTCPLDHLLIGVIQRQKALIAADAPKSEVLGPYHPSMRIFVYPDQNEDGNALSTLLANLLQRTPIAGLAERAACLFIMYHLAQWQIAPSPETYAVIPEWQTASPSQLMFPHPIWVSHIPFGKLRDQIIADQETYATDEFQALFFASINLNWPQNSTNILVSSGNDVRVSDEFARHCTTLANWSIGEPFSKRYPELGSCCPFYKSSTYQPS